MKKRSIVLWSIITYVVVCLLELLICKSSIIPHWGLENYTLFENILFYVIIESYLLMMKMLKY